MSQRLSERKRKSVSRYMKEDEPKNKNDSEEESIEGKDDDIEEFTPPKKNTVTKKVTKKTTKINDKENLKNNAKKTPNTKKKATNTKQTQDSSEISEDNGPINKLYSIIKRQDTSSFASVVREWVKSYNKNKNEAVLELVNLIIRASNNIKTINVKQLDKEDSGKVMKYLTKEKEKAFSVGGIYAITSKAKDMKHFSQNFGEFWDRLITSCGREIIYDDYMSETLISWIQVLGSSSYRAFRHTATFVALQMIDSIIALSSKQRNLLESVERQIESNTQQKKDKNLTEKKDLYIENIKALETMIQSIFNSVVVHRYRDVFPPIRSQSVEAIGRWCINYPAHFLKNVYTKYLGWTLYDTVAEVRLSSLKAVKKIYSNEEFVNQLDLFTQRFSDRIVEMRMDKDNDVSVVAIQLLDLLICKYEKVGDEDVKKVLKLVQEEDRTIRHAVAKFINNYLFDGAVQTKNTKKNKQMVEENLKTLADFITETFQNTDPTPSQSQPSHLNDLDKKKEETAELIVDSIWEHAQWLVDWPHLTSCLLDEEDTEYQLIYAKIIITSIKRSVGQEVCGKLLSNEKTITPKQKTTNESLISEHFIKVLPDLFNAYKAENFIGSIVEITNYLQMDLFTTQSAESSHQQLISNLSQIYLQNPHPHTLELIAGVWQKILDTNYPQNHDAYLEFTILAKQLSENFTDIFDRALENDENLKDEEIKQTLFVALKRLECLYKRINLKDFVGSNFIDQLDSLLATNLEKSDLETNSIISVLSLYKLHILWWLQTTHQKSSADRKERNKEKERKEKESQKTLTNNPSSKKSQNKKNSQKNSKEDEGKKEMEDEGKKDVEEEKGEDEKKDKEEIDKEDSQKDMSSEGKKKLKEEKEKKRDLRELIASRDKFVKRLTEFLSFSDDFELKERIFETINDIFIFFSVKKETKYRLALDEETSELLKDFVRQTMKLQGEEEEEVVCKVLLTLSKSILSGVFPFSFSELVLLNYNKHGKNCSSLMKAFLSQLRQNLKDLKQLELEYEFIFDTLKAQFLIYLSSPKKEEDEKALRDLANSLCFSYGVKPTKELDNSLLSLVKKSFNFSLENFEKGGYSFLHLALSPFTSRVSYSSSLLKLFKQMMLKKEIEPPTDKKKKDYKHYKEFMDHLEKLSKNKKVRLPSTKKPKKTVPPLEFEPAQSSQAVQFSASQSSQAFLAPSQKPPRAKRKLSNESESKEDENKKDVSESKERESKSDDSGENFVFSQSSQPVTSSQPNRKLTFEFNASQSSQTDYNPVVENDKNEMEDEKEDKVEDEEDGSPNKKAKLSQEEILVPASQDDN